jgi:formamidopyrimidine-DNA glycosylase
MPELPEVELHARRLREAAVGRRVVRCDVPDAALVVDGPDEMQAWLPGRRWMDVSRRGKYLLARFEAGRTLIVHLRMTGRIVVECEPAAERPRGLRMILALDDGTELRFIDPRRFGRIRLCETAREAEQPELARLGPDALLAPISAHKLAAMAARSRRAVKALLMDQSCLAGLGNICAGEILFRCGIHPARPACALSSAELTALAAEIPVYLNWAIEAQSRRPLIYMGERGAENVFAVYRRAGEPCPRCGTPLAREVVAGRGTYLCPSCQR